MSFPNRVSLFCCENLFPSQRVASGGLRSAAERPQDARKGSDGSPLTRAGARGPADAEAPGGEHALAREELVCGAPLRPEPAPQVGPGAQARSRPQVPPPAAPRRRADQLRAEGRRALSAPVPTNRQGSANAFRAQLPRVLETEAVSFVYLGFSTSPLPLASRPGGPNPATSTTPRAVSPRKRRTEVPPAGTCGTAGRERSGATPRGTPPSSASTPRRVKPAPRPLRPAGPTGLRAQAGGAEVKEHLPSRPPPLGGRSRAAFPRKTPKISSPAPLGRVCPPRPWN